MTAVVDWLKNPENLKAAGPVIVGLAGIMTGLVLNFLLLCVQWRQNSRQNSFNERQLNLTRTKEEREEILRKLNTFYGPFKELRTQSRLLYGKFMMEERQKGEVGERRFRTLRYLLDGGTLNTHDKEILDSILAINKQLLKLIEKSSGVVDKVEVQELLGRLGTHIRVLQLARDGKLSGPADNFEDIVFPVAVDGAIESAILRLQERLREITDRRVTGPGCRRGKRYQRRTVAYYNRNAEAFASANEFADMSELYQRFRRDLAESVAVGGRILDAGCGSGRDTRYFIENGYAVVSFDVSEAMVRKCNEYPHAFCMRLSFDEMEFKEEFDGVWACASLLHLRQGDAKDAVRRLTTALKPGGVMLVSVKSGKNGRCRRLWRRIWNKRYFEYYNERTVKDLWLHDRRLEVIEYWRSRSSGARNGKQIEWENLTLRRKKTASASATAKSE